MSSKMCCSSDSINDSPSRKWLKILLFIWLVANFCRQAFDLIGRLWLPVFVNLLQILILIAGIFAAFQARIALLIVLTISCIFSILYNVTLILWYNNVFGDTNRPLLSLGLPHGYSFFVQNTPFCDSTYNVANGRWTQHEDCLIPYGYVESLQAGVHILLAVLTAVFSILMARHRKISEMKLSKAYASRTQLNKMQIAASGMPKPNCKAPNSNSSTTYLNSSYENPENLVVKVPQMRRKTPTNLSAKMPKHKNVEQNDNFSSAPTIELNSNKSGSTNTEASEQPRPQKILRALPERRSCGAQLAKILDQSIDSNTSRYSKIGNSSDTNHSKRRSEYHLRPTASANNAVKLEDNEEDTEYMETRSRIAERLANLNGEPVINKTSPYHKRQGSAGNLTSLISFDPKSETLIQVHEHQEEESEDEMFTNNEDEQSAKFYRPNSRDSAPTFPAPTPPRVFASQQASDSGHHSTSSNDSANWSQGGISFPTQFQSNYMPQPSEIPLRFNQTKSPESINYEQLGYPLVATAFPVVHSRQRSYCGVTGSTSLPLAKQDSPKIENKFYNKNFHQQDPIVSTHFSRAFHSRWISGDKSHEDLPPPPQPTKLISNTTNLPQENQLDPRIEGLLV